jgi:type IV pilus assembly protein PilA
MENPYAQAAAPTAATPEQQKLADYELAIGQNAAYYLPKFEHYDSGGSTPSWNWPAFFVTSGWYLYRKMWLWGLLNLFFPLIASFVVGMVAGVLKLAPVVTGFLVLGTVFAEQMLLTIFANALYWRHINAVIRNVPRSIADKPDRRTVRLERDGGTSIGAAIGILVGAGFFGVVVIGMMAAIAIPAYQDYTIRAQVMEGLSLAGAPKEAVAEYYANQGSWPVDAESAGVHPVSGKYVESVTVANGSVVITYGGMANQNIANGRLILVPGANDAGDIIWTCGDHAPTAPIAKRGPGPSGSSLANKYLPAACRAP